MSLVVALAIVIIFIVGAITGIVLLVSWASRREDKKRRLSVEAPDRATLAGRYLTSLYIRRPGDAPELNQPEDGQQPEELSWPHRGSGGWPR
jgi:hypothetical protein